MTPEQAILKLQTIKANQLIASSKVARSRTLRPSEKARTSDEYRSRVEAVDMAIKALSKPIHTCRFCSKPTNLINSNGYICSDCPSWTCRAPEAGEPCMIQCKTCAAMEETGP